MNTFKERREQKIERFKELAVKNKERAESRYSAFKSIQGRIPLGQPIMVGHHSERGHRADIKRMDSHLGKMSEHFDKAEYYERKAEKMENNKSIFIEDPEALEKLSDRLTALKNLRDAYKTFNKTWRKEGLEKAIEQWPGDKDSIRQLVNIYCKRFNHETQQNEFYDIKCLPSYLLVNLGAKIKRYESKVETVQEVQAMSDTEFFNENGIKACIEEMRVNVYFETIPNEELRSKLKRSPLAMKWSPLGKCWTRKLGASTHIEYFKKCLIEVLKS